MPKIINKSCFLILLLVVFIGDSEEQTREPFVDFCRLFHRNESTGRLVRTEAILRIVRTDEDRVDGGEPIFYSFGCNNRDSFALADFVSTENVQVINSLIDRKQKYDKSRLYRMTVLGRFSLSNAPGFGHLSFARAQLEVDRIIDAKEIMPPTPAPDWKSKSPVTEAIRALRSLDPDIMNCLISPCVNGAAKQRIADSAKITINGRAISVDEFLNMDSRPKDIPPSDLRYEYSIQKITKNGNVWTVAGKVEKQTESENQPLFSWESKYLYQTNRPWKLIESRIRTLQH